MAKYTLVDKSGNVAWSGDVEPKYNDEGKGWDVGGSLIADYSSTLSMSRFKTIMTPIRFKAQFSVHEQVAIKRARAYAGEDEGKAFARDALDILFGSLDDPRLAEVDVADPSVIGGIDFVRSLGILTEERAAAIKLGLPQTA